MKIKRFALFAVLVALAILGLTPLSARADGIIVPRPRPGYPVPPLRSLAIKYHRVAVMIENGVATTTVDQVFLNENSVDLEGEYLFPLPEGASISSFAMWVDGQRLEAQILDADEARDIYEEIVRQQRDPALLEYAGRNAFRARIYPIPARGEKRVQIEYSEVLPRDSDMVRYVYPLNTEKFSTQPLEEASVSVTIRARSEITALYSPSHEVRVDRAADGSATVEYHESDVIPDRDFVLYYGLGEDDLGINLISYKPEGEDGYFLLLLTPPDESTVEETVARDVTLILDVSGSMRGDKLEQAKDAAQYILDHLGPEDRFDIVAYSSGTRVLSPDLLAASRRREGRQFIETLNAGGGTNIQRAFQDALRLADGERPQLILFFTDGLPTEGETRVERILEEVARRAPDNGRVFAFGVGYDVNTWLLDRLAQDHGGTTVYVRPEESIERAVSGFYDKIASPVLSDVTLDYGSMRIDETFPYPLPDLFAGEQLVLTGRYREPGSADITLRGTVNGRQVSHRFEDIRFRSSGGAEFIPRLWATRKVGHLLTQIRLHGADKELVEEVIALGTRYGIATPYTSFLVDEGEDRAPGRPGSARPGSAGAPRQPMPPVLGRGGGVGGGPIGESAAPAAPQTMSGKAAVDTSVQQEELRQAEVAAEPQGEQARIVGVKTFQLSQSDGARDGVWVDSAYEPTRHRLEKVEFGSPAYFDLLTQVPEAGRYLALGERVLFVQGEVAYQIGPEGGYTPDVPTLAASPRPPSPTPTPMTTSQAQGSWIESITSWFRAILKE